MRALVLVISFIYAVNYYFCYSSLLPRTRRFVPLPGSIGLNKVNSYGNQPLVLRVQQFNALADGLSGLRQDLGGFSRAKQSVLNWDRRKEQILHEITQYDADVITLQEIDHYYDFFLPNLSKLGYIGHYAPKPTSACLDVSGNNDGVALFIKKNRLRVISCETTTLALSIAGVQDGELIEDSKNIKLQNQVGLIAICEFVDHLTNDTASTGKSTSNPPPPVIITTTHLKSSKSSTGERYRQKGVLQVLDEVDKIYRSLIKYNKKPVVILTGDFNAVPEKTQYSPLAYNAVKSHRLGLRSIYNDDVPLSLVDISSKGIYTTFKARYKNNSPNSKKDTEVIIKRCIDFIFYGPYLSINGYTSKGSLPDKALLENILKRPPVIAFSETQLILSTLLRFAVYTFGTVVPLTSLISSSMALNDKIYVVSLALMGLAIFEIASEGTIFKPQVSVGITSNGNSNKDSVMSESPMITAVGKVSSKIQKVTSSVTKDEGKPFAVGIRAISALDLFDEKELEPDYLPSEKYPSDHISIAADLLIVWDK